MNKLRTCLFAISLGVNLAFAGIWLSRALTPPPAVSADPSSLHRRIGVTRDQWKRLAPLVDAFKQASRENGQEIKALRCRLLDLLEAPAQDDAAIRSTQAQLNFLTLDMKKRAVTLLRGEKEVLSADQYSALIKAVREKTCRSRESLKKGGSFTRILINDPDLNGS